MNIKCWINWGVVCYFSSKPTNHVIFSHYCIISKLFTQSHLRTSPAGCLQHFWGRTIKPFQILKSLLYIVCPFRRKINLISVGARIPYVSDHNTKEWPLNIDNERTRISRTGLIVSKQKPTSPLSLNQELSGWETHATTARYSRKAFKEMCRCHWPHKTTYLCIFKYLLLQVCTHQWRNYMESSSKKSMKDNIDRVDICTLLWNSIINDV